MEKCRAFIRIKDLAVLAVLTGPSSPEGGEIVGLESFTGNRYRHNNAVHSRAQID